MRCRYLMMVLLLGGCGESARPTAPGATPAATPASGFQTVQGNGYTVQAPANWMVTNADTGVNISAPLNADGQGGFLSITLVTMPPIASTTPEETVARLLPSEEALQITGEVKSEMTISGRPVTKYTSVRTNRVDETSDRTTTTHTIKIHVPLRTSVMVVQVLASDEKMKLLTTQVDAILASVQIQ